MKFNFYTSENSKSAFNELNSEHLQNFDTDFSRTQEWHKSFAKKVTHNTD